VETTAVCRVVVCDDQAAFRELVSVVLNLEPGLEVVGEAADGKQGIDVVTALKPDVLVLDLAMPEMDGIEALPHIRQASPDTQVIVVTGFGSASVKQRTLDAGAALFAEKGTDVHDLVGLVKGLCR
jgi:two-component system, chemotaxis family, chemotaxis protein CheY